ncbi:TnsA-like heteromeric transposase endonuclease subunit [Nocardia carnea]|uniref:TnsA-like heteromeric transposase endonuclease subunit n=1 Tax=Nocardia carnea TaxID=37328 RepID=UPI0024550A61|nr:TnsA-like heteromeric transposase endonuclease subunit [Nocardia carnea]
MTSAERRVSWGWLPEVVDELERPVRSFPSYRGQRNYPGWYWACTLGRLIGFESWVERDHLVALDFDAAVVGIVSQPFWLVWTPERGKPRRHAPDFLVRSADGTVAVLDSRPLHLVGERDRKAFAAAGRACAGVGWGYAVWDRMGTTIVANQRWLAGYRHPRCFDEVVASRLLGLFATPRPLMEGAELAGDPLGTLPVLYHLLWKQLLVADLAVVLSPRTIVQTAHDLAEVADSAVNVAGSTAEVAGGRR